MAIMVSPKVSSAVADAYKALAAEEAAIVDQIKQLQTKQKALRDVLDSMGQFLAEAPKSTKRLDPQAAWPFPTSSRPEPAQRPLIVGSSDKPEEEEEEEDDDLDKPFAGMRFSQALWKHMQNRPGMPTTVITKLFEEAGWKFSNDQWNHKVNQVGVTLRRFQGRLFEQDEEKNWYALEQVSA